MTKLYQFDDAELDKVIARAYEHGFAAGIERMRVDPILSSKDWEEAAFNLRFHITADLFGKIVADIPPDVWFYHG